MFNNLSPENYFSNNYFNNIKQQNYLGNNELPWKYCCDNNNMGIISISKKNKTPDSRQSNWNKQQNYFQNYERPTGWHGAGWHYNLNENYNNEKYMNPNNFNLKTIGMNENNERNNNYFSNKNFEKDKNQQIHNQNNNRESNYDKEILKVFIYIYYYEKITMKENIFFNSKEKFYLINPKWIEKFKNFYSYDKLKKKLESFSTQYNYFDLDKEIENIIYILSKEDIFRNVKFFPDLKKINSIMTILSKINNILFTSQGIIIPAKIMNIINNLDKDIKNSIKPKTFHFKSKLVYYINSSKKIIIGFLKNNIKFIPNYIFDFNNDLEQSEIKKLISTPINDYINQIKCDPNSFFQNILNKENEKIGNLLIINKGKINSSNSANKYEIMDNQNYNELFNKYNNLVIKLKKLEQELSLKNEQNENIKKELDNLKIEKIFHVKDNEDKTKEIIYLKSEIEQLEKNKFNFNKLQQNVIANNEELNQKQQDLRDLNERNKILLEKKTNLEKDISKLLKINDNLKIKN